jgi:hypothetical protein
MDEEKDRIELTVTRAGQTIVHTATREEFAEDDDLLKEATILLIWTLWTLSDRQSHIRYK